MGCGTILFILFAAGIIIGLAVTLPSVFWLAFVPASIFLAYLCFKGPPKK